MVRLDAAQLDRAVGALLGAAAGDALGAPYEFGPPIPADVPIGMVGGGPFGWEPGEWTDDTQMALVIARVAAEGGDLRREELLDQVAAGFVAWADQVRDIGNQTRAVLRAGRYEPTAETLRQAAADLHSRTGRTAGNGSLMRTAPVALAHLDDPAALVEASMRVSELTHHDPVAGEACALWCLGIRSAVMEASLDGMRERLDLLPADRRDYWRARLAAAEAGCPVDFAGTNGWVVSALQGAWSAVSRADGEGPDQLVAAVEAAVRGGNDTDTVGAIAGALAGARWGATAIPQQWRDDVHGWPGYVAADLERLVGRVVGAAG